MKIVKTSEVAWADNLNKGAFQQRRKELGSTGKMSAGLWELAPGKKSFPFHMHHVTEEALYVVSGSARVRTADGMTPISAGDCGMFPPGPSGGAHQLINDGPEPMVYLALGVSMGVDIVEYPDSGKIVATDGKGGGRPPGPNSIRHVSRVKDAVDYWEGE